MRLVRHPLRRTAAKTARQVLRFRSAVNPAWEPLMRLASGVWRLASGVWRLYFVTISGSR
jgi:hypothetical protein